MPLTVLTINGKRSSWGVTADLSREQIEDMRADGVDVGTLENTCPAWAVDLGLMRVWFFFQDLWNFKWLRRDGWPG